MTDDSELMDQAARLTELMREHQSAVHRLSKRRRKVYQELKDGGRPVAAIAKHVGVSDQAVFHELRKIEADSSE